MHAIEAERHRMPPCLLWLHGNNLANFQITQHIGTVIPPWCTEPACFDGYVLVAMDEEDARSR